MRWVILAAATCATAMAHDLSTSVTWSREISRLVMRHCAGCHHEGGQTFALTTFPQAHDRAQAISKMVRARRMPPFGAVKGFGDLKDDSSLTQEQIELFVKWVQAGAMEGDPSLAPKSMQTAAAAEQAFGGTEWPVTGSRTLEQTMTFGGVASARIPEGGSVRVIASRPDGTVTPLIWFYGYDARLRRAWQFRKPVTLPAGTRITASVSSASFSLTTAAPGH